MVGISFTQNAVVAQPGQQYAFSSLVSVTPSGRPEYVVLTGLDIERYASTSNANHGTLSGNGQTANFSITADRSTVNLVFTYTDNGYYNNTYGYLSDLSFKSSTDNFRNEFLSLYGFGIAGTADADLYAKLTTAFNGTVFNGGTLTYSTSSGQQASTTPSYIGTLDIVTRSGYVDPTPNQATPNEIAAVATALVGQTSTTTACWVLANNIAATAGATLPLSSWNMYPDVTAPVANGEWFVAYNSATVSSAQQMNWPSLLRPGDVVCAADSCGGHVEAVVSGFSYSAQVIDNQYTYGSNVGNDITILPAHAVNLVSPYPADVVIYRLDAPVVAVTSPLCLNTNASKNISTLFAATDPAGKPIVSYQFYDSNSGATGGSFTVGGLTQSAHSASTAISVDASSLAGATFTAGSVAGSDSILVRAYNGSYWGDWQSIAATVGSAVQPAVVRAISDTVLLHGSQSLALSSLFAVTAQDSPVTSFTIWDPTQASNVGRVQLNGATDLLNGTGAASDGQFFKVSAADFSKLTYVGGTGGGGEAVTVTAHNGAALDSTPAAVVLANAAPRTIGISHWVSPGAQVPLSSLFFTQTYDSTPIVSYTITTDTVVLSWGANHPSSGGSVQLNGAANLWTYSAMPHTYQVSAADLNKVTFQAASDAGDQILEVWANNGANGVAGMMSLFTVAGVQPVTAHTVSVAVGATVSSSSLFDLNPGVSAPIYYRFIDPSGGGSLQLSSDIVSLQSTTDLTPGVIVIRASDLNKLSYVGGGSETITISTSNDNFNWSAEVQAKISTTGNGVVGGAGNEVFVADASNTSIDGGAGVDTAMFAGNCANYTISASAGGYTVKDNSGANGSHTLSNIERIQFADKKLALDLDGSAGLTAKIIGAAFGAGYLSNTPANDAIKGQGISIFDAGITMQQLATAIVHLDAFVKMAGSSSNADFVKFIFNNVVGQAATTDQMSALVAYLNNGMTQGDFLATVAGLDANAQHIGLVGLAGTGLEFL